MEAKLRRCLRDPPMRLRWLADPAVAGVDLDQRKMAGIVVQAGLRGVYFAGIEARARQQSGVGPRRGADTDHGRLLQYCSMAI